MAWLVGVRVGGLACGGKGGWPGLWGKGGWPGL